MKTTIRDTITSVMFLRNIIDHFNNRKTVFFQVLYMRNTSLIRHLCTISLDPVNFYAIKVNKNLIHTWT